MALGKVAKGDIVTQTYALGLGGCTSPIVVEEIEHMAGEVDTSFLFYLHTIIHVESSCNPEAVSSAGAVGLMQLTGPAVVDAAKFCRIPEPPVSSLFLLPTNIIYGTCYLSLLLDMYGRDWHTTLVAYHGGHVAANKLQKGQLINANTANYITRIKYLLRNTGVPSKYTGPLPGISTGGR